MALTEFHLYIWGNTFIHISCTFVFFIVFPKFLKTHFFNKTVICILKSVELGMLKMSVNISA